jgi:putative transcriptional regulator
LPQPLRDYVGGDVDELSWQRLGLGAYQLLIPTGNAGTSARLLCIPAGRPVPAHSHGGLELTLVLAGAFSDATGQYGKGDFQEADENIEHQPHAAPGEDCICLAVTDAPLRFKSIAARLVQPLLGI